MGQSIKTKLRTEDFKEYEKAVNSLSYCPVVYTNHMIDYYLEYFRERTDRIIDKSIIIMHENMACGVWPITLIYSRDTVTIGSNGGSLLPPLFKAGLPTSLEGKLIKLCYEYLLELCRHYEIKKYETEEQFINKQGVSEWHLIGLRNGNRVVLGYDIFLNLERSLEDIKAGFRRRYKALINQAARNWDYEIYSKVSKDVWLEFQDLHYQVSGRKTRSGESWDLQYAGINAGQNFFIGLRDANGCMVGGGLFATSKTEGFYAVGAYDRSLFDKPVGHLVQYLAIEEMVRRGLSWYLIGKKFNTGDELVPTEKQIKISNFKAGFCSHIFPRYTSQIIINRSDPA